jgi:aminoglycoside 6-adenylyltransferase
MTMNKISLAYETLIGNFIQWATTEDNLRAVVMIGSRARSDHPADEWSDLDLIFFSNDPTPFWESADWIQSAGKPMLSFTEPLPAGDGFERRVLYDGGLDVDFVPLKNDALVWMSENGPPPDFADMLRRGVRILLDKDGTLERVLKRVPEPPHYTPPSEAEFLNLINDFWFHTVWTGKHIRRGELWWGKSCCDGYLKNMLRQMLEWHAHVNHPGTDTWLRGRFLEEWIDPRARASLPEIYARYNEEDVWLALTATLELFRWLSMETAHSLGYEYPLEGMEFATELVHQMDPGRKK